MIFLLAPIFCALISAGLFMFIDHLTDKVLQQESMRSLKLDILLFAWTTNMMLLIFNILVSLLVVICVDVKIL